MDDFVEFVQYAEDDLVYLPIPRMYLGDAQNPLEMYTNTQLLQRFRFSRRTIQNILLPMIYPQNINRGLPVLPIIKLCISLRFYASGSYQRVCGDLLSTSQPSSCRIIKEVSQILARNLQNFVKLPETENEKAATRQGFYNIAGFPVVIGCIDGTHIEIKSPGGANAEVFRNRKGWMSLNVQGLAGPKCEIYDLVIRWPGSAHDSRIFNSSSLKMRLENRRVPDIILGDSAYQQTRYLYTPILNPATPAEQRYNSSQIRTRNVVERTFGIWKGRFRCLTTALQYNVNNIRLIIAATAVLHNICIKENEDPVEIPPGEQRMQPEVQINGGELRGNVIRSAFIQRHFV